MNYDLVITDIKTPRKQYPDSKDLEKSNRFQTLDEYLLMAKKVIKKFGPEFLPMAEVQKMVNSENAVAEIARHLMMADWDWQEGKGRTAYSYRNQCGKWAIQDFLGLFNTKANKSRQSLDIPVGDNINEVPLSSITEDALVREPGLIAEDKERKERVKKYISFLLKNSKLSEVQEKCIRLRYIEGVSCHEKIGQMFNPPITRQAVKQNIDRALYKLEMTAKGSKE